MNRLIHLIVVALSLLLVGCPKDKPTDGGDAQPLTDANGNGSDAVIETPDALDTSDTAPDSSPADTFDTAESGSDAKVYIYVPADPCAEEPAAPAEGSPCATLDELRCSDFMQMTDKSFSLQTTAGWHWLQVCKRLYVLRCESSTQGPVWKMHLAANLVASKTLDAGAKSEGVWCLSDKSGVALEPGLCKGQTSGHFKACPASMWGKRGCVGSGLVVCGTHETIDAMLPSPKAPWHKTANEQLGESFPFCSSFGRQYVALHCSLERITCKFKDPNTGQITYPDVPGDCIPDNDTGAHCATTCEEIGMEGPE